MTKHPKRRPRDPNMARDHQIPNFSVSCNKREIMRIFMLAR
jgi:hypothetical protein